MGVGTVTTREKAESKGKCTAGQSSGQVMLVPLDQCPGQCIHSRGHGVNPLGVIFVFLREFDVSIVVLDLNGVGQTPKQKGGLLQDKQPLQQQFPERLYRQVLSGTGLGNFHAKVLVVPFLAETDGQICGVVPVIVHLQDLPIVVRFPLADPVVHIAVVRHIPWGNGAVPRLGPWIHAGKWGAAARAK